VRSHSLGLRDRDPSEVSPRTQKDWLDRWIGLDRLRNLHSAPIPTTKDERRTSSTRKLNRPFSPPSPPSPETSRLTLLIPTPLTCAHAISRRGDEVPVRIMSWSDDQSTTPLVRYAIILDGNENAFGHSIAPGRRYPSFHHDRTTQRGCPRLWSSNILCSP